MQTTFNMKGILLAAFIAGATISVNAVPILQVSFTQDNWIVTEEQHLVDGVATLIVPHFLNGVQISNGGGGGYPTGTIPELQFHGFPIVIGLNTAGALYQGVLYTATFTVEQPTGNPPAWVPDGGLTIGLLAMGLGALRVYKTHWGSQ